MSDSFPMIHVRLPKELVRRVDHFAVEYTDPRSRSQAMRVLLAFALTPSVLAEIKEIVEASG